MITEPLHSLSNLVLCSASPRRVQLLRSLRDHFFILPADFPEESYPQWDPPLRAQELATAKAQSVAQSFFHHFYGAAVAQKLFHQSGLPSNMLLPKEVMEKVLGVDNLKSSCWYWLAADTLVAMGQSVFEKPQDVAQAREMLQRLAGSEHEVFTGVALLRCQRGRTGEWELQASRKLVKSIVEMMPYREALYDAYLATGEYAGKAGAYGIQGQAQVLIKSIHGSLTNIIGLPLSETEELLKNY